MSAEAMADFLLALSENARLARAMVDNAATPELVEALAEQQAQQLTVVRLNAAVLVMEES